ncbi:MAG: DUF3365 domain-containing protein [Thioalkalispiraceae bacterium]|jgi:hypothetical protein
MRTIITSIIFALAAAPVLASDVEDRVNASRATVKSFMKELKGELQSAMKAGGPVNAIQVCNQKAPQIAARASDEKGWNVGRTSLKLRNQNNAPDDWEKQVMQKFEQRKADGEDPKKIEFYEVVTNGDKKQFRYMKAIPTAPVCLACHGEKINPEVTAKLDQLYPDDKARGFKAGDIRGAFTIIQPM